MYDAHTHLNSEAMYPERQRYMDLFLQAWGKWLVNSGASDFYNEKGIEISKESLQKYPSLWIKSSIGQHPLECVENVITKENIKTHMQTMVDQYKNNKEHIVAIWETGIDVHFPNGRETLDLQKEVFALQADFAQEIKLPLIVHSRDTFDHTLDILQNYKNLTIHFHCWTYGPEEYYKLKDIFPNIFIGFCGNLTYKNAQNLRDTIAVMDKNQIVFETDAPYLAPQIVRWQTNHPAFVEYIYQFAAEQLQISRNMLDTQVEKNIAALYKK